jgi:hypothetical protein
VSFSDLTGQILDACTAAFGETVEHRPAVGSAYSTTGIYSERGTEVDGPLVVQTNAPALGIKLADFTVTPKAGDRVYLRSTVYKVARVDPDGEGGATLHLHKV